jgi:acyl-CoA-binding protein
MKRDSHTGITTSRTVLSATFPASPDASLRPPLVGHHFFDQNTIQPAMTSSRQPKTSSSVYYMVTGTLVAVSVTAAYYYLYSSQKSRKGRDNDSISCSKTGSTQSSTFAGACNQIALHQDNLLTSEQLLLYALYKQATVGNAPAQGPLLWHVVASAKHSSWASLRNMSNQEAQDKYVYAVQQIVKRITRGGGDDDEDEDWEAENDMEESQTMAPVQSRPAMVETGGHKDDDDDETDTKQNYSKKILSDLFQAAALDNVDAMKTLLQQHTINNGGNSSNIVNASDPVQTNQTILHLAADKGSLRVVQYLLQDYASIINVNAFDNDGISVLQTAAIAGQVEVCRLLLQAGANPDQADHDGDSARSSVNEDGSDEMRALFQEYNGTRDVII